MSCTLAHGHHSFFPSAIQPCNLPGFQSEVLPCLKIGAMLRKQSIEELTQKSGKQVEV